MCEKVRSNLLALEVRNRRFKSYRTDQVLRVSARESHTVIGFFEGLDSVKQREARILSSNIRDVGQVSQVAYRDLAGLV